MTAHRLRRAAFVYAMARALRESPTDLFARLCPGDQDADVFKTAAPLGTTTGSQFVDDLVQTAVGQFLASLAPMSAAAALMRGPNALTLDVTNTINAFNLPLRSTSPAVPGWVPEGEPIAVKSDVLATVALGPARKIGSMVALSREAFKRSDAAKVFNRLLAEDAAKGLDAAVFSAESGSGDAIAGLLSGATEVPGTGDALRDLKRLASAVSTDGSGQLVFVTGPAMASALALDASIRATILPSPSVAETRIIAVDPLSLAWGADSEPGLEVSNQAVIHMETETPLPIVATGPTPAAPVRSAWQTDSIVTRLILHIAFVKRRADAAAFIDHVDYES